MQVAVDAVYIVGRRLAEKCHILVLGRFIDAYENVEHVDAEPVLARVVKDFQLQRKQGKANKRSLESGINNEQRQFGINN